MGKPPPEHFQEPQGLLAVFARDVRQFAGLFNEWANAIEASVFDDLQAIRREGKLDSIPRYREYGVPDYGRR